MLLSKDHNAIASALFRFIHRFVCALDDALYVFISRLASYLGNADAECDGERVGVIGERTHAYGRDVRANTLRDGKRLLGAGMVLYQLCVIFFITTLAAAARKRSATRSGVSPLLINASAPAESAA